MENLIVNSYDEWTQLREVIVGNAEGFEGFHVDNSFALGCWDNLKLYFSSKNFFKNHSGNFDQPIIKVEPNIIQELNEDIENFVAALKSLGVIVRRPSTLTEKKEIQTPFWDSFQTPPLNIRDQTIILGSNIVETAPQVRARFFENDYLKPLFYEYAGKGAHWLAMPRPTLCAGSLDPSFFTLNVEERVFLQDHYALPLEGVGFELLFDGAQCIRVGKDVLVNVANQNHELGFQWLQTNLGNIFDFHRVHQMSDTHIDSIILPLREGLWLIRDPTYVKFLPEKFRKWDFIYAPERKMHAFPSYKEEDFFLSSKFLDINVLSVNENTVIVNSYYPELIKELENNGFDVISVPHRHGRLFGGGFHCFTLDIRRDGNLKSYGD